MIDLISSVPPSFILILGALLVPFVKGTLRNVLVIALPAIAFLNILNIGCCTSYSLQFLGFELELLRADMWAKVFGYVFTIAAFATAIYGYHDKKASEFVAALMYIGSALGVVFAGDLVSLYIFWELMAVTSVALILSKRTLASRRAGTRYIIVHVFGGLVLLAGIMLHIHNTGSIAFTSFTTQSTAAVLILLGFLVNAAAYPLSSWLPDAYPEASAMGAVVLSAYTSKTAVYALMRGFPGWDILIIIGCAMAIYGVIYGLLENDIRRILAYSIVNQVGFMVCAVGVGSKLALAAVAAHAFCHILYKGLLFMSAGAVIQQTGKSKLSQLGGLAKSMPWTFIFMAIGALTIAGPLSSGFISKTMILKSVEKAHLFWPWLILEIGAVGVFLNAGLRLPYFTFFGKDSNVKAKEAPKHMLIGMAILAFLCIAIGIVPAYFYQILPHSEYVQSKMYSSFSDLYVHHFYAVLPKLQLVLFTILGFFLCLPIIKRNDTITLDTDWFYRKGADLFYNIVKGSTSIVNDLTHSVVIDKITKNVVAFTTNAPANAMLAVMVPIWKIMRYNDNEIKEQITNLRANVESNSFPVGLASLIIIFVLLTFTFNQ